MLTKFAKKFASVGRRLARRFPRLANSAIGRAAKAAVRELVYPTSPVAWRRSLPEPAVAETAPPVKTETPPPVKTETPPPAPKQKRKPKRDPDAITEPISPVINHGHSSKCDLVMCCAFSGRHRILSQIVQEAIENDDWDVRFVLVGSTEEDQSFIESIAESNDKIAGFTCENRPLGRKWQTCVHWAVNNFDAGLYCIVGSDDFISSKLINTILKRHKRNLEFTEGVEFMPAMYCALEWMLWHQDDKSNFSPNIIKCSYEFKTAFQPLGAGRFYTKRFLESCGGIIFDSTLDRLLDDRGFQRILDNGASIEYYSIEDGPLLSVKGNWSQLNSFSDFLNASTLIIEEFSFEGYAHLRNALSNKALNFLAKPSDIDLQYNFSDINIGIEAEKHSPSSANSAS